MRAITRNMRPYVVYGEVSILFLVRILSSLLAWMADQNVTTISCWSFGPIWRQRLLSGSERKHRILSGILVMPYAFEHWIVWDEVQLSGSPEQDIWPNSSYSSMNCQYAAPSFEFRTSTWVVGIGWWLLTLHTQASIRGVWNTSSTIHWARRDTVKKATVAVWESGA